MLTACATTHEYALQGAPMPEGSYSSHLSKWTDSKKEYSGIVASYQVNATLLSPEIIRHQIFEQSSQAHLTSEKYAENLYKALDEAKKQTSIFVALYTEKDENNDLESKKTLWNIFLDVGGKRISPVSVKRLHENQLVMNARYPYVNSWVRNYLVVFPISTDEAVSQNVEFVLAGPLGAARLKFPQ